ncbi:MULTISPECIES: hypothetical protein [unclassified Nonomuraea]|uniref:hypothetical protein n=1 Tax=unclassified Nonomuraea TaxID=2593643 RepID=UPI0033DAC259
MGWTSPADETYAHEGYALPLVDSREPDPIDGNTSWWVFDGKNGHPRATRLQAGCECGWRATATHEIDWDAGLDANEGDWEHPGGPYADWLRHVRAATGGAVPSDVEELLSTLGRRLGELSVERPLAALRIAGRLEKATDRAAIAAAVAARRQGATWEAVGSALGATRQAAFQRFSRHLTGTE